MIPTTTYAAAPTQYPRGGVEGVAAGQSAAGGLNHQDVGNLLQQISILKRPTVPSDNSHHQAVRGPQIVYPNPQSDSPARQEKPAPLKTPLALLNEICSKHNILPKTSVQEEGSAHNRVYTVSTTIVHERESWEGTGKARNLKTAKQEAARNLLINIDAKNERLMTEPPKAEVVRDMNSSSDQVQVAVEAGEPGLAASAATPTLVGNPVGDLAELCVKFKFPMPEYEEMSEGTGLNNTCFAIRCSVGENVKCVGQASTKKLAKRFASAEALKMVRDQIKSKLTSDEVDLKELAKLFQSKVIIDEKNDKNNQKNTNLKFTTLADKVNYFRSCKGPTVSLLTKTNFKDLHKRDPVEILNQLCEEQKWKTEFMDFGPTADEPKYRSLVSCTVEDQSLFLLSGLGSSSVQARKSAVAGLLEMLRHLLGQ